MTPQEFVAKWKPANLSERGAPRLVAHREMAAQKLTLDINAAGELAIEP